MAEPKIKVGEGDCPACKRSVVWRKTPGGATSCFCQHCDFQGYAKHKTEAERLILASVGAAAVVDAPPPAAPAAAPEPAPKKPAPPPKPAGIFGLGGF